MKSLFYSLIISFFSLTSSLSFAETTPEHKDVAMAKHCDGKRDQPECVTWLNGLKEKNNSEFRQGCNDQFDDYKKAITDRSKACSKVGLANVVKCQEQVLTCQNKSNKEKRKLFRSRENKFCALTPVKDLGSLGKKVEKYDTILDKKKNEVEKYEDDIKDKMNDINNQLQTDVDTAKDAIQDFNQEVALKRQDFLDKTSQELLAIESTIEEAKQEKVNLANTTELKKAEFTNEAAEIHAKCGQQAAAEFKRQEIEYQKRQAAKISRGQYQTSGFGLFFGNSSKKLQGGIDREQKRKWLAYLETECTLDKGVALRKDQLKKAAAETDRAYQRGLTQIDSLIKAEQKKAERKKDAIEASGGKSIELQRQQLALSRLVRTQVKAEQALYQAQQEVQQLQVKLLKAQNEVAKYERMLNTIEQSIADTEERASETDVDTESKANDINLVFESVNKLMPIIDLARGACGCEAQEEPMTDSYTGQEIRTTPPRNNYRCSTLDKAKTDNKQDKDDESGLIETGTN